MSRGEAADTAGSGGEAANVSILQRCDRGLCRGSEVIETGAERDQSGAAQERERGGRVQVHTIYIYIYIYTVIHNIYREEAVYKYTLYNVYHIIHSIESFLCSSGCVSVRRRS